MPLYQGDANVMLPLPWALVAERAAERHVGDFDAE